jgi:hypothetical protein
MAKETKKPLRYGIFYRSNGRFTTSPYKGFTFTRYSMNRRPLNQDIATLRNYILKSKMMVLPVGSR